MHDLQGGKLERQNGFGLQPPSCAGQNAEFVEISGDIFEYIFFRGYKNQVWGVMYMKHMKLKHGNSGEIRIGRDVSQDGGLKGQNADISIMRLAVFFENAW